MKEQQTILSIFKEFPAYAFNYVFGLVLAIISDITLTSMALGSFFLGYATTAWAGLAVFFLTHTAIKAINALNGAIVQQGRLVAQAGSQLARVFDSQTIPQPAGISNPQPLQDPPAGA
jgi:hypothetical protein